ncbi:unnamed protein product [Leptosia nina]|uniref:Uncharacterized protein n=1 Tax=Leptosia nina TaxID=320188 RepID=A0AAV1JKA5_9NEOP
MIPAYSVSALRLAFDEISTVLPVANQLASLLIPFLINLINNLNNLSNIVQNLTPALLPYFGCTLPLLYATLTDLTSVLFLYISVLISLFRSNLLAAPGLLLGLVSQVKSTEQFQQIQAYPLIASYANTYGSQPIVLQAKPYNQQYTIQTPLPLYQPPANQIQDAYFNNFLSNPAIQAFIDPGTKVYNQNGLEISEQIRPRTPNVVNNYFIVPTDYLNETILGNQRQNERNYNGQAPRRIADRGRTIDTRQFNNNYPGRRQNNNFDRGSIKQSREYPCKKNQRNLQDSCFVIDDQINLDEPKNVVKRLDDSAISNSPSQNTDNFSEKPFGKKAENTNINRNRKDSKSRSRSKKQNQPNKPKEVKLEDNTGECDDSFDICDECCELENRNIRNSIDNRRNKASSKKASKAQDLMSNWMSYMKMFMPDQNMENIDFDSFNFPYNFQQMYQTPTMHYGNEKSTSKRTKKRKPKEINNEEVASKQAPKRNQNRKSSVQPSPTLKEPAVPMISPIEREEDESKSKPKLQVKISDNKPIRETYFEEIDSKIIKSNADVSLEDEMPISSHKNAIDYYPDFTQDAVYATDEDDLYFFHNRHYYTGDQEGNREKRKDYRASENRKQSDRRMNDIPSSHKDTKDKFRTPPGLSEPGFQTRKVNKNEREDFYTYYVDDVDNTEKDIKTDNGDNNVETVYARSKVVKYGQQRDLNEKPAAKEQDYRNEKNRGNSYAKDGDTTVVFSKPWN